MKFDLAKFKLPENFRGRNPLNVQLWWLVQSTLFSMSPQFMYPWRSFLLRLFGATVGYGCVIRPSVKITYPWKVRLGNCVWLGDDVTLYSLGDIEVGSNSVISQKSYLCTGSHDYNSLTFDIFSNGISIGEGCWLATDVYVGPGVGLVDEVVIGARSSVFKSIVESGLYIGSPCRKIKDI